MPLDPEEKYFIALVQELHEPVLQDHDSLRPRLGHHLVHAQVHTSTDLPLPDRAPQIARAN